MVSQTESEVEQGRNLVTAVRSLGALQRSQLEAIQLLDSACEVVHNAGEQLREAEYLVAQSEVTVSQKNLVLLDCRKFFKETEPIGIGFANELDRTRRLLWSVGVSGEDQEILEAAQNYGEATRAWHANYPKHMEIIAEIKVAMKELDRVKAEHVVLVERQVAAQQKLRDAHDQMRKISSTAYGNRAIFDLEKAVVDLAHSFTGTEEMTSKYKFVETKDLPISIAAK